MTNETKGLTPENFALVSRANCGLAINGERFLLTWEEMEAVLNTARQEERAALAAKAAPEEREGWVLVPREPTAEIEAAMRDAFTERTSWGARAAYRAALVIASRAIAPALPADVVRLVIAARGIAFDGCHPDADADERAALQELDDASEAFADRVPWEGEPEAAAPLLDREG